MTGSRCWPAPTGWRRRGSGRWRRPWSGATGCSMSRSGGCSGRCRCSRRPFTLEAAEAVAGAGRGSRRCCGWWTARCWSRRGPGPMAGARYSMLETLRAYGAGLLAAAGEQDQAAAALAGYAVQVAEQAAAGMTTSAGEPSAARGWMPRTPPWGRCWPGRWNTTWTWRRGWWPHWACGGRCAGGWPARTRCCVSWPGAPSRAARGGAPRSSGSAATALDAADLAPALRQCAAVVDISGTGSRPGSGGLPGLPSVTLRNLGRVPEAAGCAAAPWPWPVSSATQLGQRRWPGTPWPSPLFTLATGRRGATGPADRQIPGIPGWPPGRAASCWPRCSPRRGTWPPPSGLRRHAGPGPGTRRPAGPRGPAAGDGDLDLQAARIQDAAAHLREAPQIALRTGAG